MNTHTGRSLFYGIGKAAIAVLVCIVLAISTATFLIGRYWFPKLPAQAAVVTIETPTKVVVEAPPCKDAEYTIVSGDWLSKISAKYYDGKWYVYPGLAALNNIPNPDKISVGKVITIPCDMRKLPNAPVPVRHIAAITNTTKETTSAQVSNPVSDIATASGGKAVELPSQVPTAQAAEERKEASEGEYSAVQTFTQDGININLRIKLSGQTKNPGVTPQVVTPQTPKTPEPAKEDQVTPPPSNETVYSAATKPNIIPRGIYEMAIFQGEVNGLASGIFPAYLIYKEKRGRVKIEETSISVKELGQGNFAVTVPISKTVSGDSSVAVDLGKGKFFPLDSIDLTSGDYRAEKNVKVLKLHKKEYAYLEKEFRSGEESKLARAWPAIMSAGGAGLSIAMGNPVPAIMSGSTFIARLIINSGRNKEPPAEERTVSSQARSK